MSLFLKNNKKYSDEILTLSFFRELSKKEKGTEEKTVNIDSDSDEIAEIISERLLKEVQKKLILE